MNHEEWELLLSAYTDDEVSPEEREQVKAHLQECAHCAQVLADYRRLGLGVRALPRGEPSRELWWRIREHLPTRRRRLSLWRRLLPVASALATLVLGITLVLVLSPAWRAQQGIPLAGAPPADTAQDYLAAPTEVALKTEGMTGERGIAGTPAATPAAVAPAGLAPCPVPLLPLELIGQTLSSRADLPTPRLSGILYDPQGQPFGQVALLVTGEAGWQKVVTTQADGTFSLTLPVSGTYAVALAYFPAGQEQPERFTTADLEYTYDRAVTLPDIGNCLAPSAFGLAPLSLGPHNEVRIVLRVR